MAGGKEGRPIIIKRVEVVEGGHHGGAWKVAYADFVTAMMAFFLLMWLLNATTETQRKGLADYFAPSNAMSRGSNGTGMPFGGKTPNSEGSLASDRGAVQVGPDAPPIVVLPEEADDPVPITSPRLSTAGAGPEANVGSARRPSRNQAEGPHPGGTRTPTDADLQAELDRREKATFERAAQQIRDAVRSDPALADLGRQLMIDVTPEGLRVQLVDEDKQPMFPTGSAQPNERARAVLVRIASVLSRLPQPVSITGHTDSAPYKGGDRSNWDLSADRANATRRLLTEAGVPEARMRSVSGMADRDLLLPKDGMAAVNRRIAITVMHEPALGTAPAPSGAVR